MAVVQYTYTHNTIQGTSQNKQYIEQHKKYIEQHNNLESNEINSLHENRDFIVNSSFWVPRRVFSILTL
jgi:hypothetical protein